MYDTYTNSGIIIQLKQNGDGSRVDNNFQKSLYFYVQVLVISSKVLT